MIELPGIGRLTYDSKLNWYISEDLTLRVLGGHLCRIILAGYDEDDNKQDFLTAASNFVTIGPATLWDAEEAVYQYYRDCAEYLDLEAGGNPRIDSPHDVWEHVQFGGKALVVRRAYGDRGVYVSLECECDWEEEHGLQIVFRNGLQVNKVGAYDGHCTNADAYGDEGLEGVIYKPV